jgi:transposase
MHRRRVLGDRITYVGLDVHKQGIVAAVAEDGLRGEVREYGRIANTPAALDRLARQLSREGVKLRFCCEAGPCGYGIHRTVNHSAEEYVRGDAHTNTIEGISQSSSAGFMEYTSM